LREGNVVQDNHVERMRQTQACDEE